MQTIEGKVWTFGKDIDTDLIIAARYLNTSVPEELAKHVMEDADPSFVENMSVGDIIVADDNFGCGSSREHAPIALKAAGVAAVIAPTFARIFTVMLLTWGCLFLSFLKVWKLVRVIS